MERRKGKDEVYGRYIKRNHGVGGKYAFDGGRKSGKEGRIKSKAPSEAGVFKSSKMCIRDRDIPVGLLLLVVVIGRSLLTNPKVVAALHQKDKK